MRGRRGFLLPLIIFLSFCLLVAAGPACPKEKAKEIIIGIPTDVTNPHGQAQIEGVKLAVKEINEAGGVTVGGERYKFKVEVVDTRELKPGVPVEEALRATEKLILEKKADVIIGTVRSEAAIACLDLIAAKYKKPWISCDGVWSPTFTKLIKENYEKYKYAFRIHGNVAQAFKILIPFVKELREKYGWNAFFIMVQDVKWARDGGDYTKMLLEKEGFECKGYLRYPTGATDFTAGLRELEESGARILILWIDMPELTILLRDWRERKIKALPIGYMGALHAPGIWKEAKGVVEYAVPMTTTVGGVKARVNEWHDKFLEAFQKEYGHEPMAACAADAYMATYVMKDAIERAGRLDSDAIVRALEETDMVGIFGKVRFDRESHEVIAGTDPEKEAIIAPLYQFIGGERICVYPNTVAVRSVVLPPWMAE